MRGVSFKYCHAILFILLSVFSNVGAITSEDFFEYQSINNPKIGKEILLSHELVKEYESMYLNGKLPSQTNLKGVSFSELFADLRIMLSNPNGTLIGNNGNYCGTAAILNWLLNCHPEIYTKAVLELACYGETRINENTRRIKMPAILTKIDLSVTDTIDNRLIRANIDSTGISDFILGVSLTYSEKLIQKVGLIFKNATYKKKSVGNFIFTNTPPWEINDLFRKFGIDIEEKAFYLGDEEDLNDLRMIETAVKEGKLPIIFDNHLISYARGKNCVYKITGIHFITIHSLSIDEEKNIVNYTYWDYGSIKENPWLKLNGKPAPTGNLKKDMKETQKFIRKGLDKREKEISIDEFLKAMKGYWIPDGQIVKQ